MRSHYAPAVVLLSAVGLAAQSPSWPIEHAPPELKLLVARADVLVIAMQDAVLRELAVALAAGGPERALASCHIDSRLITERLRREGVRAGRTSDRRRNPANAAPAWVFDIVNAHAGQPAEGGRRRRDERQVGCSVDGERDVPGWPDAQNNPPPAPTSPKPWRRRGAGRPCSLFTTAC